MHCAVTLSPCHLVPPQHRVLSQFGDWGGTGCYHGFTIGVAQGAKGCYHSFTIDAPWSFLLARQVVSDSHRSLLSFTLSESKGALVLMVLRTLVTQDYCTISNVIHEGMITDRDVRYCCQNLIQKIRPVMKITACPLTDL